MRHDIRGEGPYRGPTTITVNDFPSPCALERYGALRRSAGFTLMEVMVAIVLIGIGISASLVGMSTSVNTAHEGKNVLQSGDLAGYIKQLSRSLYFEDPSLEGIDFGPEESENGIDDYDDIDDLDGLTLSPPVGADRSVLTGFQGWSQVIQVFALDPDTFEVTTDVSESSIRRIEVEVRNGTRSLGRFQWLVSRN